jgi:hypothetical protein
MRFLQAVPAIFMFALAAGVLLGTADLRFWDGFTPGPRFFPGWLAGAGTILALLLLVTQWRGTDTGTLDLPDMAGLLMVLKTTAGLIVLALLTKPLGMVPALSLFVLYMLFFVLRAAIWPSLLTTGIIAAGIEGIFVRWLGVPLPAPFFF